MIKTDTMLREVTELIILLYNVISETLEYMDIVQRSHYQIDVIVN